MHLRIISLKLLSFMMPLVLFSTFFAPVVSAEEIAVTGNASDTSNNAQTTTTQTSQVTTTNETSIDNTVSANANTGSNSTSDNAGNSTIMTGDTKADVTLSNEANSNVVQPVGCCSTKGTMTIISGNGTGSNNAVTNNATNSNTTSTKQTTTVTNIIQGSLSTGGNTANNNSGNVTIQTGTITVRHSVKNGPLNYVAIDPLTRQPLHATNQIVGNGSGSQNVLTTNSTSNSTTTSTNTTVLNNFLSFTLITGENTANGNHGNVTISTGDTDLVMLVENGQINVSKVTSDCHCDEKKPDVPVTPSPEKITPQTANEKASSGSNGEVASIVAGKVLPITGMNWLIVAFFGNVMMLLLGMILRLRSGNGPGVVAQF